MEEFFREVPVGDHEPMPAARDVEFHGASIKAGDSIMSVIFLANCDSQMFDDPLALDFDRKSNKHLTFAAGSHRCLGSHLARHELAVGLQEWHAAIPDYRVADRDNLTYYPGVAGIHHLRLEWDVEPDSDAGPGVVEGAEIIGGCTIRYRVRGEGMPVALTPGGRLGMEVVASTAEALARSGCRVKEWDRVNTGTSDVWIGPGTEHDRWSDDLAELLGRLAMAPAWIAGGSVGATVSLRTAIRHPEVTRGVVVWSVPGGFLSSQRFGYGLHVPFIDAAYRGGMAEVATTDFFAERIAANPANGGRLAAMDPVARSVPPCAAGTCRTTRWANRWSTAPRPSCERSPPPRWCSRATRITTHRRRLRQYTTWWSAACWSTARGRRTSGSAASKGSGLARSSTSTSVWSTRSSNSCAPTRRRPRPRRPPADRAGTAPSADQAGRSP